MLPTLPTPPAAYPVLSDAKFKQLAAAYDTNSFMPEQIKVELDKNMQTALASLAAHQKYVDGLADAGKQILLQAKAAVTKADKGQPADQAAALKVAFNAERELIKIAKLAHDDHQSFDGAWNQFRALGVKNVAPKLPDNYLTDFIRAREKVMADGKLINVKVAKLEQYTVQAKALTKLSADRVGTGRQPTANEALTTAQQLEEQIKEQVFKSMGNERLKPGSGGKNIGWFSVGKKMETIQRTAGQKAVTQQDYATAQQYYVNMQAAVKTYKATVKTLDTLSAVAQRAIAAPLLNSPGVAGALANAKTVRDEAAAVSTQSQKVLDEATKLMTTIKKKAGVK
jgi:hypothetical protein